MVVPNIAKLDSKHLKPQATAPFYSDRNYDVAGSAAGVVTSLIGNLTEECLKQIRHFRQSDEPNALHDLRVSLRRLSSNFRSYRSVLGKEWTDQASLELKGLMQQTSAARDLEVEITFPCYPSTEVGISIKAAQLGQHSFGFLRRPFRFGRRVSLCRMH